MFSFLNNVFLIAFKKNKEIDFVCLITLKVSLLEYFTFFHEYFYFNPKSLSYMEMKELCSV